MKVKDLFEKCSFDELVPFINPLVSERVYGLYCYREAFDFIKGCVSDNNLVDSPILYKDDLDYLRTTDLDSLCWSDVLSRELVFESDKDINLPKVAANCLWVMTAFGCSLEDRCVKEDQLDRTAKPCGGYYQQYMDMLRKYANDDYLGLPMNGPKRMRLHRLSNRIGYIKEMTARETLFLRMNKAFSLTKICPLIDMDYYKEYVYRSVSSTDDERLDYILQSIRDYQCIDTSRYDGAFFWVTVSEKHPLTEDKWIKFQKDLHDYLGLPIEFGSYSLSSEQEEIAGFLLLYKNGSQPAYSQWRRGKFPHQFSIIPTYFLMLG